MQTPVQVTYRSIAHSDALSALIQDRASKLEELSDKLISCHVVVELDGHHQHHGQRVRITVNVGLPGHEVVVNHAPKQDRQAETAEATATHAFDEAERQLEAWVGRQRSQRRAAAGQPS